MSTQQPRDDGLLFEPDYLLTPNRSVAESVLWPVPVLRQSAQTQASFGELSISPGDVLELISERREEFLLVVAIPHHSDEASRGRDPDTLVCYSTNTEAFRQISLTECETTTASWSVPDKYHGKFGNETETLLSHRTGVYAVHDDVVSPVDDDPVASVSLVEDSPITGNYEQKRPEGYYPYRQPPNPMSPNYPRGTYSVEEDAVLEVEDVEDQIIQGDAAEVLQRIPDNTFHSWVTSPPYPQAQRDYNVDGQIGIEVAPGDYLENLLSVILQAMRVTRTDGTGWVVLDDAIADGEYVGVPDRLVAQLKEEGFKVIHNGPWVKDGGKPDPAYNRFAHTHERVIGIANSEDYFFHRRAVDDQSDVVTQPTNTNSKFDIPDSVTEDVSHDAMFSVELAAHLISVGTPQHVCPNCGAPLYPEYEVTDILDLEDNRHKERVLDAFHRTPEMTREHARACRAMGISHAGQAARTEDGAGQNSDRVTELVEEVRESDFPNSYIREFSYAKKELTGFEQSCNCESVDVDTTTIGGLVLDPFVGSGTTCSAAVRHDRRYTGIDLNEDYVSLARERLSAGVDASITDYL